MELVARTSIRLVLTYLTDDPRMDGRLPEQPVATEIRSRPCGPSSRTKSSRACPRPSAPPPLRSRRHFHRPRATTVRGHLPTESARRSRRYKTTPACHTTSSRYQLSRSARPTCRQKMTRSRPRTRRRLPLLLCQRPERRNSGQVPASKLRLLFRTAPSASFPRKQQALCTRSRQQQDSGVLLLRRA